jgi:hypothetical protein
MSRKELEAILDFIMNRADEAEFEVIQKACERRMRDRSSFGKINGLGPAGAARKMAEDVQRQMGVSLEGVRSTVKSFVEDIIRKNAPEISEEELAALLDAYVPDPASAADRPHQQSTLPPDALVAMVRQFVEYSQGLMPPSKQRELWESMPRWQDEYWAAFPGEVKALIKAYLEGKIDSERFGTAILSVLGL